MSARRTDMDTLVELVRLHRLGDSQRRIARLLGMGRQTVADYQDLFRRGGLLEGEPSPEALPDPASLRQVVEAAKGPPSSGPVSSVAAWRDDVVRLMERGAGPTAIHQHLTLHASGYDGSLPAIKRLCAAIRRERDVRPDEVAIRVETGPGEVAQVDFGDAGRRLDPATGTRRRSWLFVMTLGCSRHMYVDLVFDQTTETWQRLHADAFTFFGGVPRVIVPDNLKAAVIRASFGVDGAPDLNRGYRELARHYGFRVDPTPPRSPEKKGKVEAGVRYVAGSFLRTFTSIDLHEDRRQLWRWNERIAALRQHGTTGRQPREHFESVERAALQPLPTRRWAPVRWRSATVHRDAHVQLDGAFYSVPWRLVGRQVQLRVTAESVAIHHEEACLWTHPRAERGRRVTREDHLPEHRRDRRHRDPEHWLERAAAIGPEVRDLVQAVLDADEVLLDLRRIQGIVLLLERQPSTRARATARRALHFGSLEFRAIKAILDKGLDLQPIEPETTRAWATGAIFARRPHLVAGGAGVSR
ncbi:MAG: IS21 family transposase [Pseudomonadota bacterium]